MHEQSLVAALLKQAVAIADQHQATVTQIDVEAGPLSGVEPVLLRSAFDRLAPDSRCAGARLKITEVDLVAVCRDCGREQVVEDFRFVCESCNSVRLQIIRGDALRLMEITVIPREDSAALHEAASGMQTCHGHQETQR